jgi:NADH-quinone oxidoreductase subunit N
MNWVDSVIATLPEDILVTGIVLAIIVEIAGYPSKRTAQWLSLTVVALAMAVALWLASNGFAFAAFPGHYSVNATALSAKAIVLALSLPVLLIARDDGTTPAFFALVLSSLAGICALLSANSFLTLFLGLELMSLPVYALILLGPSRRDSPEAALKYLVLGGTATATLLMGASLLYGLTGTLALSSFADALAARSALATMAIVLVVVAFFLKAAIVPFHAWAPDAYEGASVPVTAYMAAMIKAGVLLAAVRLFGALSLSPEMTTLVASLPLVSIVWGNLTAMRQQSFRRMIAYSSIAHAGYLFYAFLGEPDGRFQAVAFYVLAYGVMNVLALAALPRAANGTTQDRLDNLRGLFSREPVAAVLIALAMLSLAGIPPLPGFIAKFLIFKNVIAAGFTSYAVLGLVGSYLGLYFYLRVIQYLFMSAEKPGAERPVPDRIALGASLLCIIVATLVGVFPGWIIDRL